MACSNHTETLVIDLDQNDNILNYSLSKSCNCASDEPALIRQWAQTCSADSYLNRPVSEFLKRYAISDPSTSDGTGNPQYYQYLKHYYALYYSLASYLGQESAGPEDCCAIAEIRQTDTGTQLISRIQFPANDEPGRECAQCSANVARVSRLAAALESGATQHSRAQRNC